MIFALLIAVLAAVPDTLTLEVCLKDASAVFPGGREVEMAADRAELRLQNLSARWLPQPSIRGQAIYHSDVARLPIDLPNVTPPSVSKDQYRVGVAVDQLVYDGGLIGRQKVLEGRRRDLEQQHVRVAVHELSQQVRDAYFAVLLTEARGRSLRALREDLTRRLETVRGAVAAGVLRSADEDVLAVEVLRTEQELAAVASQRRAALALLGELTGRRLDDETRLVVPSAAPAGTPETRRPELRAFRLTREVIDGRAELVARRRLPVVAGFAEANVGRPPGLDLFNDAFRFFYQVGLRVSWSPWDWSVAERDKQILRLEGESVDVQQEEFERGLRIALAAEEQEIRRLEEQLALDDSVRVLRGRISREAASQLENGVITATQYLTERHAEDQAALTGELRRLELARARFQRAQLLGWMP